MFNVKWAVFPAGAAFMLALIVSLISGQGAMSLLHALIFGAIFFGIGCGAWVLISSYIPDLLLFSPRKEAGDGVFQTLSSESAPADPPADAPTGSKVNITLDDGQDAALPAALPSNSYDLDGIGNIAELVSRTTEAEKPRDMDQAPANGYTTDLGGIDFATDPLLGNSETPGASTAESGGLGNFSSFLDGMAAKDMMGGDSDDSLSDLFQALSSDGRSAGSDEPSRAERRTAGGGKPSEVKGDFSPKEIALGIRTALAKEKKRG